MTVTLIGATRAEENAASAGTLSCLVPGGTVGELLLAEVAHSDVVDIPVPAGWTEGTPIIPGVGGGSPAVKVFYRWADASDTSSTSYAWSLSTGRRTIFISRWAGVDSTTPFDSPFSTVGTAVDVQAVLPEVSPTAADAMLVSGMILNAATASDLIPPPSMTDIATTPGPLGTGRRTHMAYEQLAASGPTGARTWTETSTTTLQFAGWMVPLKPASTGGGTEPTPTPTAPEGIGGSWTLDFHDEFDGTSLDTTKWRPNRYGGTSQDNPFNAVEGAYFDPSQVTVSSGAVHLTVDTTKSATIGGTTYPWASGTISSEGNYEVPDGAYLEARIWIPHGDGSDGTGLWPAFWQCVSGQWPPETDIFEFFDTSQPDQARPYFNYHYDNAGVNAQTGPDAYGDSAVDYRGSWHTYGVLRQNGTATPYLDGVAYPNSAAVGMVDQLGQFIILNLSVYASGAPRNGAEMQVDWVRSWVPAAGTATAVNASGVTATATASATAGTATTVQQAQGAGMVATATATALAGEATAVQIARASGAVATATAGAVPGAASAGRNVFASGAVAKATAKAIAGIPGATNVLSPELSGAVATATATAVAGSVSTQRQVFASGAVAGATATATAGVVHTVRIAYLSGAAGAATASAVPGSFSSSVPGQSITITVRGPRGASYRLRRGPVGAVAITGPRG